MLIKQYHFVSETAKQFISNNSYIYLDIETTGLKRDTTILYLIGCGYYEKEAFHIVQWFNDDGTSEPAMILALKDFLSAHPGPLFTFNGEGFDIPYLNRHYVLNDIDYQIYLPDSLDLYRILRPFQTLFRLPHGRQKDWEKFLGIFREDTYNGGQLINIYKQYLITKKEELLHLLLLHNKEDIQGMEALLPLSSYDALLKGQFTFEAVCGCFEENSSETLEVHCRLVQPLPKPLHISVNLTEELSVSDYQFLNAQVQIVDDQMTLFIPVFYENLKYFYSDYKNYFYLPEEDRAIHKSVGCFVDSAFREKAKPSTCYIRKKGKFLPLLPRQKYKGIQSEQNFCDDSWPLYKREYKDKYSFIEMDALFSKEKEEITTYLYNYMKDIFIFDMKKAAT